MKHIVNLQAIPPHRRHEIMHTCGGSYTYKLIGISPDRLNRASKGFTLRALEELSKRYIIFETRAENGEARLYPIPEQFPPNFPRIAGGSFNVTALRSITRVYENNCLFEYAAFCPYCGKKFSTIPTAHKCGEVACTCGKPLKTTAERKAGRCTACATKQAAKLYSYHNRPNRATPLFEKPDSRNALLHIGAEIEIDGGSRGLYSEHAEAFSKILNPDPFKPFAEFERDGSLHDGIETITAPTTWAGFKAKDLTSFYIYANAHGEFNSRNGLHFHFDRAYFKTSNPDNELKSAVLIDLMIYKYFDFFATICRRPRGCFNYTYKKDGVHNLLTASAKNSQRDHSMAVNQSGSSTIELRIFGGYIKTAADFFAALDIAQALARWAKFAPLSTADRATPCALVKYIKDPANVLEFVTHPHANAPHTTNGDFLLNDFTKALKGVK